MFTGREYEPVFNMYYYRARYYSPDLGRFMSQDPLEFDAGDLNLYRYIGNGPLNGTDPDGENSIIEYVILNSLLINCGYNLGNFMYAIHECYFSESNPSNLMDCLAQLILNLNNIIWMALSCGTAMKGGGKL